jgi:signal transduction histidine kinase
MSTPAARACEKWWLEPAGIAFVTALVVAGSIAEAYPQQHYGGLHLHGHPQAVAYLLLIVPVLALFWRRTQPVAVFAVAVAGVAGWAALGEVDGAAIVVLDVALFAIAVETSRRATLVLGVAGAALVWLIGGLRGPWGWIGGPQLDLWGELLAAGAIGVAVASRRDWRASERENQEQARREREHDARRRVDAERLRIARELHDVVAHSMAMISVQAAAAAVVLADDPDQAMDALQAIRRASKDGLRELRAILDVLRQVDGDEPAVAQPDIAAIAALVEATSAAGTPTELVVDGSLDDLPPQVALATYRIVQESLTNVIRHAGRAHARVAIQRDAERVLLDIVDDGTGSEEAFAGGAGTGLAGMTERAGALGGTLRAAPRPGGGFGVHAELPGSDHPESSDAEPATGRT